MTPDPAAPAATGVPGAPRRACARPPRPAQGWRSLLLVYGIVSTIEALGVAQVFAFLPLRLREVGLPEDQIPTFTGLFTSLIFVFGIVLVPFWGVWADKYSRRAVIVRSAVVEAVVFAGVALAEEPWQLAVSLLLVGLQLGNTGVMLAALRDVTPRHRVGTVTALFGATEPARASPSGPVLAAFMIDGLGLPLVAVFWLGSALSLAAVVLLLVGSRDIRPAVIPEGSALSLARQRHRRRLRGPGRPPDLRDLRRLDPGQPDEPAVPAAPRRGREREARPTSPRRSASWPARRRSSGRSSPRWPARSATGSGSAACSRARSWAPGRRSSSCPSRPGVAALAGIAVVYAAFQASTQSMVFGLVAVEVAPERRSATLNLVLLPALPRRDHRARRSGRSRRDVGGIAAPFVAAGIVFLVGGVAVAVSIRRATRARRPA